VLFRSALDWLRAQGCRQFLFKYCSTFDSTQEGNIGPVADALADALGARQVIVCPAFPATGRSIYQGHLFVKDRLLSESGMQHHPLTPMTDADIRRWLSHQTQGSVGLVDAVVVRQGPQAIQETLAAQDAEGHRLIVADAIVDDDLVALGRAAADLPLLTGGSGIAMGLPANFAARGELAGNAAYWQGEPGQAVVLSGSCAQATRDQVARHKSANPAYELDADAVMAGTVTVADLADWAMAQDGLPLIYSSADPARVAEAQARHGQAVIADAIENIFSGLAAELVKRGCKRLISAGGETSGAVVGGLDLSKLEIGPEIAPGVPAMRARPDLVMALKSGNFGGPNFFAKAAAQLGEAA